MPSLNLHASMGRQHRPNKKTYQGPFRGKKQNRGKEGNHGGGLLTWASVECLGKVGAFEQRRAGGEVSHGSSWGGSIQSIGTVRVGVLMLLCAWGVPGVAGVGQVEGG